MANKSIVSNSKLTAIGNAIRSKTGKTASLTLDQMANEISNISTGGVGGSENRLKKLLDAVKHCSYLFTYYEGTSVEDLISYSDTENVTDMEYMFEYCSNLQTIPQLNTSKVTDTKYMFRACTNLQTIPQLNTSNVTNMKYMFERCNNLQTIPLLDTSKVTTMSYMFDDCYKLSTIDITSMDKITSANYLSYFANSCYSLTKLIIRTMTVIPPLNTDSFTNCYHFEGIVNATYNPEGLKDGRIYVPDDKVEELKQATNWSTYADIIVPLSSLEE